MSIKVSGLVAAWIEGLQPHRVAAAFEGLTDLEDVSRRYLHDTEGTEFEGLGWHSLTLTRDGPFVDLEFHYKDILFTTDCRRERVIVILHQRVSLTVLTAWRTDPSTLLGSTAITLPPMTLSDSSSEKGVTSLILTVENRDIA
ncbi:hypothetical protein P8R33_05040 [Qipengyuania sp. XHP0211]|uniref:hypothetical protein n=1 Tax=Qipengyuania sp. XHP0211 TaxID=3038079 RepID=UPI00241FAB36|nr:hypothetical protein [Qipengyuania sp. XHP0211]MDG5750464.1 hypothetical protein [Qipengyuania sp. XHP0211]